MNAMLAQWLGWIPEPVLHHAPALALAAALSWGAGLRLYLVVFIFGLLGRLGWWPLPENLEVLAHPAVLVASGFMSVVELSADKIPWVDSAWDAVNTFIRIPAGAALAAAVFGDSGAAWTLSAALLGGTLTATTHFAKAGTRAAVNTSPEPFSNIAVSVGEDAGVVGGLWLALAHPLVFLLALAVFVVAAVLLLLAIGRGVRRLLGNGRASSAAGR
ncbi:MAG: DUF4126 domain-containing protein [Burkholderiaceae bacterium]|jgi:hypothetical protein|nr:DUF4126 domain-containing protein [Burkholderiaceae bacterium]